MIRYGKEWGAEMMLLPKSLVISILKPTKCGIKNKKLEQLKKYVLWERQAHPDETERVHILDWAIAEIENLRAEINRANKKARSETGL